MPISFWIFLIGSMLAFLPARFDHGRTWKEVKESRGKQRRQSIIKLILLWIFPLLGLVGTVFLGFESRNADRQYSDVTNQLAEATNQIGILKKVTRPIPPAIKLRDLLNSIDPTILPALAKSDTGRLYVRRPYLKPHERDSLLELEPKLPGLLLVNHQTSLGIGGDDGEFRPTEFALSAHLLDEIIANDEIVPDTNRWYSIPDLSP